MGRMDKVNHQMKREIAQVLQEELSDPRLEFVTILEVDVSKDLQNAKVYFSTLGNPEQMRKAQEGIDGAAGKIRRLIAQRMPIRHMPELLFRLDESASFSARIEQALAEIKDESKKRS